MARKIMVIFPILALMASTSLGQTSSPAQDKRSPLEKADPQVKQLLQLMDKNQNGKISRDEFMSYGRWARL